jgi:hypothetical protein
MKVDLCFSIASIKMVNTSSEVISASMKTPCASDVPSDRVVRTFNGVGNIARTRADAVMLPTTCEKKRQMARVDPTAPVAHRARVTWLRSVMMYWWNCTQYTYSWIEQAPRYPEEYPHVNHQTEAKRNGNIQHDNRTESYRCVRCR